MPATFPITVDVTVLVQFVIDLPIFSACTNSVALLVAAIAIRMSVCFYPFPCIPAYYLSPRDLLVTGVVFLSAKATVTMDNDPQP